jgi:bifunctional non-homologous end joining protein LigD
VSSICLPAADVQRLWKLWKLWKTDRNIRVAEAVSLSSPERVLFPDAGITKGDLFEYYDRVAPALVPHLRDRPFTMKRYREGITGDGFFQKQAPKGMPSWIPTRRFETHPREGGSRLVDFPLVNSREALLWMVQMHCIKRIPRSRAICAIVWGRRSSVVTA